MALVFPPAGIFVTGTDTEVGKTYVACLLLRELRRAGWRVGAYKPAASGAVRDGNTWISDDARQLWEAAGRPLSMDMVCPQVFCAPLAPHLAARGEGRELDAEQLISGAAAWTPHCDFLVVEGAGGYLSPLHDQWLVADVALRLGYPLLIVAPQRLGVINQVLQADLAARCYGGGLPVAGCVLNEVAPDPSDPSRATNAQTLAQWLGARRVCPMPPAAESWPGCSEWLGLGPPPSPREPNQAQVGPL